LIDARYWYISFVAAWGLWLSGSLSCSFILGNSPFCQLMLLCPLVFVARRFYRIDCQSKDWSEVVYKENE
jgi:hypothetical protein